MNRKLPQAVLASSKALERMPKPDYRNFVCLELKGGNLMPVYRNGDIIIVSPKAKPRKGDRVIVKFKQIKGRYVVGFYFGKRANKVSVSPINQWPPEKPITFSVKHVESISRILWATQ